MSGCASMCVRARARSCACVCMCVYQRDPQHACPVPVHLLMSFSCLHVCVRDIDKTCMFACARMCAFLPGFWSFFGVCVCFLACVRKMEGHGTCLCMS